jgi:hypothetical protein
VGVGRRPARSPQSRRRGARLSVELVTGTFEGRIGETFTATPSLGGDALELELASCDESPHARPDHPAFSLIFNAQAAEVAPQQIFTLSHGEIGDFDLFLVPLSPTQYEAVIN